MQKTAAALLLVVAVAAGPATAGDLVGKEAPPVSVSKWIFAPEGESLAELRGRVVVLLFGVGEDLGGPGPIARLNDLRAAFRADGLRVIAVVPAAPDPVPEDVEFSLAVGSADGYGSGDGPRAVVVDAKGDVAWEGKPGDLDDETVNDLCRKAGPAFDEARADALLAYWQRAAERAIARGDTAEAADWLELVARHFGDTDAATAAEEKLGELRGKEDFRKETSAAEQYVRIREDVRRAGDSDRRLEAAMKKLDRLVERYEGTRGAARAARLLESLRGDPAVRAVREFIAKAKPVTSGDGWRLKLPKPPKVEFPSGRRYFWTLQTSEGPMKLELFPGVAPMHVSSTIYLTELGFYDGLVFHRVIPGFMAQGGCPKGNGTGDPGYLYEGEFDPKLTHDGAGVLSMAHRGPGTDGSQFFVTFGAAHHLDGKHTIFGKLVDGMDTLKKIEKLGSKDGAPAREIRIEHATITVE